MSKLGCLTLKSFPPATCSSMMLIKMASEVDENLAPDVSTIHSFVTENLELVGENIRNLITLIKLVQDH